MLLQDIQIGECSSDQHPRHHLHQHAWLFHPGAHAVHTERQGLECSNQNQARSSSGGDIGRGGIHTCAWPGM